MRETGRRRQLGLMGRWKIHRQKMRGGWTRLRADKQEDTTYRHTHTKQLNNTMKSSWTWTLSFGVGNVLLLYGCMRVVYYLTYLQTVVAPSDKD